MEQTLKKWLRVVLAAVVVLMAGCLKMKSKPKGVSTQSKAVFQVSTMTETQASMEAVYDSLELENRAVFAVMIMKYSHGIRQLKTLQGMRAEEILAKFEQESKTGSGLSEMLGMCQGMQKQGDGALKECLTRAVQICFEQDAFYRKLEKQRQENHSAESN